MKVWWCQGFITLRCTFFLRKNGFPTPSVSKFLKITSILLCFCSFLKNYALRERSHALRMRSACVTRMRNAHALCACAMRMRIHACAYAHACIYTRICALTRAYALYAWKCAFSAFSCYYADIWLLARYLHAKGLWPLAYRWLAFQANHLSNHECWPLANIHGHRRNVLHKNHQRFTTMMIF